MDYPVSYDEELRKRLQPEILAALRGALPGAAHADIGVNDAETDKPYLYASIVLDHKGRRIESEETAGPENIEMNAVHGLTNEVLKSWDGYPFVVNVQTGADIDLLDLLALIRGTAKTLGDSPLAQAASFNATSAWYEVDPANARALIMGTQLSNALIEEAVREAEVAVAESASGLEGEASAYAEALAEMLGTVLGGRASPAEVADVVSPATSCVLDSWLGNGHVVVNTLPWTALIPRALETNELRTMPMHERRRHLEPSAVNAASMVVIGGVVKRLLRPLELRGSLYSERFIRDVLRDAVTTAAVLGLDPRPIRRLWSLELVGHAFVEELTRWVLGWRDALPLTPERAMAAATAPLRARFVKTQGRKPSARRNKVMTVALEPLLAATLRTWPAFVGYLGRPLAAEDAHQAVTEAVVPRVPDEIPDAVRDRCAATQQWFRWFGNAMFATLGPTSRPPSQLAPRRSGCYSEHEWAHATMPPELIAELQRLWSFDTTSIQGPFDSLIGLTAAVWSSPASCLWHMVNGPYAYPEWKEQREYHQHGLEIIDAMGAPIPDKLWAEINEITFPVLPDAEFELTWNGGTVREERTPVPAVLGLVEPVWQRFHEIVPPLLERWVAEELPTSLTAHWRADAAEALGAYFILRDRGQWGAASAPSTYITKVAQVAERWFHGDTDALLAVLVGTDPLPARLER